MCEGEPSSDGLGVCVLFFGAFLLFGTIYIIGSSTAEIDRQHRLDVERQQHANDPSLVNNESLKVVGSAPTPVLQYGPGIVEALRDDDADTLTKKLEQVQKNAESMTGKLKASMDRIDAILSGMVYTIPTERVYFEGSNLWAVPDANITFSCLAGTTECEMKGAKAPFPDSYTVTCKTPDESSCFATVIYDSRFSPTVIGCMVGAAVLLCVFTAAFTAGCIESMEAARVKKFFLNATQGLGDAYCTSNVILRFNADGLLIQSADLSHTLIRGGKRRGDRSWAPTTCGKVDMKLSKAVTMGPQDDVWLRIAHGLLIKNTEHDLVVRLDGHVTEFRRPINMPRVDVQLK